jgi:hypothetical protein
MLPPVVCKDIDIMVLFAFGGKNISPMLSYPTNQKAGAR